VMKIEGLPVIDDPDDYSFVVKRRGNPPKPWRWEIYRACCSAPIERSSVFLKAWQRQPKTGKRRSRDCKLQPPGAMARRLHGSLC
jgi:hypothetical protein